PQRAPVGDNFRLGRQELAEFGDLLLQERRLRDPRCQRQLDKTAAWTAIWDEVAISKEQAKQSADVCWVQICTL
ncbi:hypothetical protein EBT31_20805, partial [bacterium]|nr:hypothetical protein [bacterium]